MSRLIIRPLVEQDLDDIWDYIAISNSDQSEKFFVTCRNVGNAIAPAYLRTADSECGTIALQLEHLKKIQEKVVVHAKHAKLQPDRFGHDTQPKKKSH
jgi:plasmid stabilization system protein ParE